MDRFCITLTVAVVLACFSSVEANVFSLGSMIEWLDPKLTSIFGTYSRFNDYGCYCGIGGNGRPIDQVDCCCQAHDECYDKLIADGYCPANGELSHLYSFRKITEATGKKQLQCKQKADDQCAYHLCQCDVQVATCFAANEPHYNNDHRKYDRKRRCEKERGLRAAVCNNDDLEL